ncbi:hypothetical protein [Haloferula sp.]|uniref:hypothetical protein n=1 Tax=Haloferula sp. TaxID=2497595 RepID=UPI003C74F9CE
MKKHKNTGIGVASLLLMATASVQALGINFIGVAPTDPSWTNTENWFDGVVPGTSGAFADQGQFFGATDIAEINDPLTTGSAVDLLMRNLGKLTINADTDKLRILSIGTTGATPGFGTFVKQTAGTTSAREITLGTDDANGGLYEVSGSAQLGLSRFLTIGANGKFSLIGSNASASLTDATLGNLTMLTTGILSFTFDETGVGAVTVAATFTVDAAASVLEIDGSLYGGGIGSFTLVDSAFMDGSFDPANYTVTGLGVENVDWSLTQETDGDLVLNVLTEEAASTIQLTISANGSNPGNYDFSWTSQDGKLYDLVSSTDLATPISTWSVWEGNADIAGTSPSNGLTNVPGGGNTTRFFAVIEKDPAPL